MNALEEKKRYFATKNNRPSTFQEYLEYWFWEVFFLNVPAGVCR